MGGPEQPFLYDSPARHSAVYPSNGFDPKPVTRASMAPPPPPKPKREGPLIEINKHPDSYLMTPYGNLDAKSMSPGIKGRIKWVRWIQLFFRVLQLVGAIGMLICVICIKGVKASEGWIIRIPPGVDILNSIYAIYHLSRPAKGRTPGSSASYHFFAMVMDAGFIPFYVFTSILAQRNYIEEPGTEGHWKTIFANEDTTTKLLLSSWLVATSTGSLHLISFFFDIYLLVVFRKISRLPPDMNPLEDNLTSRRGTKHKYKNSELSLSEKKRLSELTASTVSLRTSQAQDPLIPDSRTIPFIHSRKEFDTTFSPHNPRTAASARNSRVDLPEQLYQQPQSTRTSRVDAHGHSQQGVPSQRNSFIAPFSTTTPPSKRSSFTSEYAPLPQKEDRSRRNTLVQSSPQRNPQVRHSEYDLMSQAASVQSGNWIVYDEEEYNPYNPNNHLNRSPSPPPKSSFNTMNRSKKTRDYRLLPQYTDADEDFKPQPLRMNPPTPPVSPFKNQNGAQRPDARRTLTTTSTISTSSSSPTRAGTPKTRYYGDLKAATQGIRQNQNYGSKPPSVVSPDKGAWRGKENIDAPEMQRGTRVVSTGVDVVDYAAERGFGRSGRREVSGKVAEEGRAGMGGLVQRKVSGVV
ncbi:hypothetical protein M501DRAFT_924225 [Patellaria atrata CBS 101060]|uniref:Uncharacterized protein n=1 Tax=Patellaria atrata CBS 101060 TaxID=1346257 RepID=A0A9P4VR56_9PEZI|nr:hypothetical protein M501DRAFT_924225 [Patellaria atrata CBS 101060]